MEDKIIIIVIKGKEYEFPILDPSEFPEDY